MSKLNLPFNPQSTPSCMCVTTTDWLHDDTVFFPRNTALLFASTMTRMTTLRVKQDYA